jgi:hypothetical protein
MNERKYYRNVIQVEILSTRQWGDEIDDLEIVNYAITEGNSSGYITRTVTNEEVTNERMAELLEAQGTDADFLIPPDDKFFTGE